MADPALLGQKLAVEVLVRGFDRIRQFIGEKNAPIEAAGRAAEGTELSTSQIRAAFGSEYAPREIDEVPQDDRDAIIEAIADTLTQYAREWNLDIDAEAVATNFVDELEVCMSEKGGAETQFTIRYLQRISKQLNDLKEESDPNLMRLTGWTRDALTVDYSVPGLTIEPRPDAPVEIGSMLDAEGAIFVEGRGGVGKSALAQQVADERFDDQYVTVINAEYLTSISSRPDLRDQLELGTSVSETIRWLQDVQEECLFVFDQLDELRTDAARREVAEFIRECARQPDIDVFCVCRTWHASVYEPFSQLRDRFECHTVEELPTSRVEILLADIGIPESEQTTELRELASNLLNLSLIGELHQRANNTLSGLRSEASLWERYCEELQRQETSGSITEEGPILIRAAELASQAIRNRKYKFRVLAGEDANRQGSEEPSTYELDHRLLSRGVLRRTDEQVPSVGVTCEFRHEELRTYFYARRVAVGPDPSIDAIEAANIDQRAARDVYRWIFRILWETDRDRCEQFVLRGIARSEFGYYVNEALIREIRSIDTGDSSITDIMFEVIESHERLAKSFAAPDLDQSWVETAADRGKFKSQPLVYLPFLAALAPEQPDFVVSHLRSIDAPNESTALLKVVRALPNDYRSDVLESVTDTIGPEKNDAFERELVQLLKELVSADEIEAAVDVSEALLAPFDPCDEQKLDQFANAFVGDESDAVIFRSLHMEYAEPLLTRELVDEAGHSYVDTLHRCLRQAIASYMRVSTDDPPTARHGTFVRDVSPYTQAYFPQVIALIRDAYDQWLKEAAPPDSTETLEQLLDRESGYWGLGLYLLAEHPEVGDNLLKQELTNPNRYPPPETQSEFHYVLARGGPYLSDNTVADAINAIRIRTHQIDENNGKKITDDDPEFELRSIDPNSELAARWTRTHLWLLDEHLPETADDDLVTLCERFGSPENIPEPLQTNDDSPVRYRLSSDDFAEMGPRRLLKFCQLNPPQACEGFIGLIEYSVASVIVDSLEEYSQILPEFDPQTATYLNRTLRLIRSRFVNNRLNGDVPWELVINLLEEQYEERESWPNSTLREGLSLVVTGLEFRDVGYELTVIYGERLSDLFCSVLRSIEPRQPSKEFDPKSDETVQSLALKGIIQLAIGRMIHSSESFTGDGDGTGFTTEERRHIQKAISDPTVATADILGQRYRAIQALDVELGEHLVETLFTHMDDEIFYKAWFGYLREHDVLEWVYSGNRDSYIRAIDIHVRRSDRKKSNGKALVQHLIVLYLCGDERLDSSDEATLVEEFYDRADHKLATQFAEELSTYATADDWPAVYDLWLWRTEADTNPAEYSKEYRYFTQLLVSESGPESMTEEIETLLMASAPYIVESTPSWMQVISFLDSNRRAAPTTAVHLLEELIQCGGPPGVPPELIGWTDGLERVLDTATQFDDTERKAFDIAERLAEQGYEEAELFIESRI